MSVETASPSRSRLARAIGSTIGWAPLAVVAAAIVWVTASAASPISRPDSWWHLRLGNELWQQRSSRAPEDWSPRATVDWVPSEPLPEIVVARVHHVLGLPGVAWVYGASMIVVLVVVFVVIRRLADPMPAALALVLGLVAMSGSLTERPQLVSFALIAVVQAAWMRTSETLRPPWWLIPLTWVWSMCHGFWAIGVGLSVVCWLGVVLDRRVGLRTAARLALVPVGSLAVVALNPAGLGVLTAPLVVRGTARFITEWQRTTFDRRYSVVGLVMVVALVVLMVAHRRDVGWRRLLLLGVAVFFLWYSYRTVAIAGVITAPLLAERLQAVRPARTTAGAPAGGATSDPRPRRLQRIEVQTMGVVAAVCLVALAVAVPFTSEEPGGVPDALSPELDRLPAGATVLNEYGLGGWLAYRYPALDRTSDGLVVPYDPDYIGRLLGAEHADGDWRAVVAETGADYALLDVDVELYDELVDDGWTVVAQREDLGLLARDGLAP